MCLAGRHEPGVQDFSSLGIRVWLKQQLQWLIPGTAIGVELPQSRQLTRLPLAPPQCQTHLEVFPAIRTTPDNSPSRCPPVWPRLPVYGITGVYLSDHPSTRQGCRVTPYSPCPGLQSRPFRRFKRPSPGHKTDNQRQHRFIENQHGITYSGSHSSLHLVEQRKKTNYISPGVIVDR